MSKYSTRKKPSVSKPLLTLLAAVASTQVLCAEISSESAPSENTLDSEVRTALAQAVEFFKKRAAEDEEGWVIPPRRTRKVVGHETVTHRYREEVREVPVFEYEYETYEVVQKVRVGESAAAVDTFRKVKKRRVVSRKQVGTKKLKRLVRDPDGPIERSHRIPQYGPGGADVWARYALGDNALALYALRHAGVPAEDATVSQLTTALYGFISSYGYPDETWDLAWLTAAFSTLTYEPHRQAARAMASKLLDAQIRDGEATGLWGPVAINTALLAERVREVEDLSQDFQEAKKAASKGKREERAYQRIDQAYRKALANLTRVATFGMAGHTIESGLTMNSEFGPSAKLPGLSDYIYNQRSADLGSTAVALYALRQAAENETLPKELWRPESSKTEAESPAELLVTSLDVLAKKLVETRNWDEMNRYQAVTDFDKVAIFPGIPGTDEPFPRPASDTSLLTTLQGFSAMTDSARIAKSERMNSKYRRHMEKGSELFRASAESLLDQSTVTGAKPWLLAPYKHYLFLSEVTREPGSSKEDRRDLWLPLAQKLLTMRSPEGSWVHKGPGRRYHLPSSLLARLEVIEEPAKKALPEYDKPRADRGYHKIAEALKSDKKIRPTIEDVVPTACAMIFLAENVRPPVIGECLWSSETEGSRLTPLVTSVMRQQKGLSVRYSAVSRPLQSEHLVELPVLLIRGQGDFNPDDNEAKALKGYLDAGGLVLIEAAADSEGSKFLGDAEQALKEWLPDSATLEDVGSDEDLMGAAVGKAKIQAFRKANNSLAAALLPVAPAAGAKGLPRSTAARAVYNMLFQKVPPEMLEENYPIAVDPEATSDS